MKLKSNPAYKDSTIAQVWKIILHTLVDHPLYSCTKGMHIKGIMQFEPWSVANKSLQFYKKELFPIKGRIVRSTSPIKKPETSSLSHSCLRFNDCRQPNYNGKTEVAFFHSFTVYSDSYSRCENWEDSDSNVLTKEQTLRMVACHLYCRV